jgi:hypothetical protein
MPQAQGFIEWGEWGREGCAFHASPKWNRLASTEWTVCGTTLGENAECVGITMPCAHLLIVLYVAKAAMIASGVFIFDLVERDLPC